MDNKTWQFNNNEVLEGSEEFGWFWTGPWTSLIDYAAEHRSAQRLYSNRQSPHTQTLLVKIVNEASITKHFKTIGRICKSFIRILHRTIDYCTPAPGQWNREPDHADERYTADDNWNWDEWKCKHRRRLRILCDKAFRLHTPSLVPLNFRTSEKFYEVPSKRWVTGSPYRMTKLHQLGLIWHKYANTT